MEHSTSGQTKYRMPEMQAETFLRLTTAEFDAREAGKLEYTYVKGRSKLEGRRAN